VFAELLPHQGHERFQGLRGWPVDGSLQRPAREVSIVVTEANAARRRVEACLQHELPGKLGLAFQGQLGARRRLDHRDPGVLGLRPVGVEFETILTSERHRLPWLGVHQLDYLHDANQVGLRESFRARKPAEVMRYVRGVLQCGGYLNGRRGPFACVRRHRSLDNAPEFAS
jgi:hypothetical protein